MNDSETDEQLAAYDAALALTDRPDAEAFARALDLLWMIVPQSGPERWPMAAYPCPAWASAPPKPRPELRLIKPPAQ